MRFLFCAVFALAIGAIVTSQAEARSCSDYRGICLAKGATEAQCAGAWKRCMKSGIYIGPVSGTNHGQAEKR
ncbi:hypothetical protein FBZ93_113222 [Bradyrhizobium macuxiense]|uniref:Uncharacterized protein n=1 Tax=Bradyrhizobium macuxiense TaxID=1755647 RepID=A0A560L795_9BRAD|nr:hypothetical protein FBZ93_113222 [Bradyrhizobium macuxiense]